MATFIIRKESNIYGNHLQLNRRWWLISCCPVHNHDSLTMQVHTLCMSFSFTEAVFMHTLCISSQIMWCERLFVFERNINCQEMLPPWGEHGDRGYPDTIAGPSLKSYICIICFWYFTLGAIHLNQYNIVFIILCVKETTTQLEVLLHIVTRLQSTTFFSHVHTYIIIIYYYILFNEITETAYTFFFIYSRMIHIYSGRLKF